MIHIRRFTALAGLALSAASAKAQDTTVVVVRHLSPQQDTGVVVRHLALPPDHVGPQRSSTPYGAPRYAPRPATGVLAKDPRVGSMFSLIFPGGGQYYAGAPAKGLALTLLGIGAPIIGYANVNRDNGPYGCGIYNGPSGMPGGGLCREGRTDYTPAAIGLGVGITAWLYGVATAGTDVQHWNQAHGVRFVTAPGRVGFAVAVP